jgi:hypothetical protein
MDKSKRIIQRGLRNKQRVGTYPMPLKKKERKKERKQKGTNKNVT